MNEQGTVRGISATLEAVTISYAVLEAKDTEIRRLKTENAIMRKELEYWYGPAHVEKIIADGGYHGEYGSDGDPPETDNQQAG